MSGPAPASSLAPLRPGDPLPGLLRDLLRERIGIHFESHRLPLMMERIELRASALGCQSYLDYYYILKDDDAAGEEWRRVMDTFSIQETYFWREADQIRLLADRIVPEWFARDGRPLRIWSAACASGEEPYSIALALEEAGWGAHPITILASDASEAALGRARSRLYRERAFRSLPPNLRQKYFTACDGGYLLQEDVASRVSFQWANLVALEGAPAAFGAEIIFCRNVFIYFSGESIRRVVSSFARRMPFGGHLFVGASESLLRLTERFDLREKGGAFAYVRNSNP